jgi:hypothetical protein
MQKNTLKRCCTKNNEVMYNLRSRNIRVTLQDSSSSTSSENVEARKSKTEKKESENGVGNSIGNNKELYTIDYVLHEAVIPLFLLDIDDETS